MTDLERQRLGAVPFLTVVAVAFLTVVALGAVCWAVMLWDVVLVIGGCK